MTAQHDLSNFPEHLCIIKGRRLPQPKTKPLAEHQAAICRAVQLLYRRGRRTRTEDIWVRSPTLWLRTPLCLSFPVSKVAPCSFLLHRLTFKEVMHVTSRRLWLAYGRHAVNSRSKWKMSFFVEESHQVSSWDTCSLMADPGGWWWAQPFEGGRLFQQNMTQPWGKLF